MKKLLMDNIPDSFIERQMNDSRYISKVVKSLLSNIVREKDENGNYEQETTSKYLISCTGGITDRLKKDWGMNDVWNKIILPRFKRLNVLTDKEFTTSSTEGHEIPSMPLELQKGFNKKRIDHRHHAMDAIVIACATRSHVQYLNSESAKSDNWKLRNGLAKKLRRLEDVEYYIKVKNKDGIWVDDTQKKKKSVPKEFIKPWETFTQDAHTALENIVVSFKQNLRIINKTTNYYQHYVDGKKVFVKQEKGDSWAIRKPMHKDTVFGEVNLRKTKEVRLFEALKNINSIVDKELKCKIKDFVSKGYGEKKIKEYFDDNKDIWSEINLSKIEVYFFSKDSKDQYFATRKSLDTSFDEKTIEESVTDTGIRKILLRHLEKNENDPEIAFSPDGIDEMNRNIVALNNDNMHQPILKVRKYEKADKFAIGEKGSKKDKFVEAAKGTNLFFAVYESTKFDKKTGDETKSRFFVTVTLNIIIDCQKKSGKTWKEKLDDVLKEKNMVEQDYKFLFILSPNDLVYLPKKEQDVNDIASINRGRIYKMVSCTGNRLYCIPYYIANTIYDKVEFTQLNKVEFSDSKESIKEICIPIKVDRLGNIELVDYEKH
jgi:CRISPR-associated endonuclease Csn1